MIIVDAGGTVSLVVGAMMTLPMQSAIVPGVLGFV